MEKVAGVQFYSQMNATSPLNASSSPGVSERGAMNRGHHSSINKAVEAHRLMVEQRQNRHGGRRDFGMTNQATDELLLAEQMTADSPGVGGDSVFSSYENTLIESPSTQAKMASIQSFQTTEPDRPTLGEPVPKGSYLDIEV
jgi:hypothetical protein